MKNLLQKTWFQRVIFWSASLLFFSQYFATSQALIPLIDLLYVSLFLILMLPSLLLINHWVLPSFLSKGKYWVSLVLFIALTAGGAFLNQLFFTHVVDLIFPGFYFINYWSFTQLWQVYLAYCGIAALLQLSKGWFENLRVQNELAMLRSEKSQAELMLLKSQVNPHFLFNSLNSIYSLALKQSEQTAASVMHLSELLRYALYQSGNELVTLQDEVDMVNKYLKLQRLRRPERTQIEFDTSQADLTHKVPPMLIQPLFENAFKHGDPAAAPFIEAFARSDSQSFFFAIKNRIKPADDGEHHDVGGIGLENIRKRLELLYPNQHRLLVKEGNGSFQVIIEIYRHESA